MLKTFWKFSKKFENFQKLERMVKMKFMVLKASDDNYKEFKNFNSLEELIDFTKEEAQLL